MAKKKSQKEIHPPSIPTFQQLFGNISATVNRIMASDQIFEVKSFDVALMSDDEFADFWNVAGKIVRNRTKTFEKFPELLEGTILRQDDENG